MIKVLKEESSSSLVNGGGVNVSITTSVSKVNEGEEWKVIKYKVGRPGKAKKVEGVSRSAEKREEKKRRVVAKLFVRFS